MSLGGNCVHISLSQQDVFAALDFDSATILGLEQHPVPQLHGAHIWAKSDHFRPHQLATNLGRRWNHDAAT